MLSCIRRIYGAGGIEADRFMVRYAVSKFTYGGQFPVYVRLLQPVRLVGEHPEKRLASHTVVAPCKQIRPESEGEGGDHLVVVIHAYARIGMLDALYLGHILFKQPSGSCLVDYPVRIMEMPCVMGVDGIAQHDFKHSDNPVETLAQLDIVLIQA